MLVWSHLKQLRGATTGRMYQHGGRGGWGDMRRPTRRPWRSAYVKYRLFSADGRQALRLQRALSSIGDGPPPVAEAFRGCRPEVLALAKNCLSADFDQPLWMPSRCEKVGASLEFRSPAARYHFRALSFIHCWSCWHARILHGCRDSRIASSQDLRPTARVSHWLSLP